MPQKYYVKDNELGYFCGYRSIAGSWYYSHDIAEALAVTKNKAEAVATNRGGSVTIIKAETSKVNRLRQRLESAESRAEALYKAMLKTIEAFGGIARPGLSDEFLILGLPSEAAATVTLLKEAEEKASRWQEHNAALQAERTEYTVNMLSAESERDKLRQQLATAEEDVMDWQKGWSKAVDEVYSLSGKVALLREAVKTAHDTFTFYSEHHARKGDQEKEAANRQLATMMTEALVKTGRKKDQSKQ